MLHLPEEHEFHHEDRTRLLDTDDDNAINLNLNADTIFLEPENPDRVYLKQWKDPDKADAIHIKVKEELERVKCTRSSAAGNLAVTQPKSNVPQRSGISSGWSQQQSR